MPPTQESTHSSGGELRHTINAISLPTHGVMTTAPPGSHGALITSTPSPPNCTHYLHRTASLDRGVAASLFSVLPSPSRITWGADQSNLISITLPFMPVIISKRLFSNGSFMEIALSSTDLLHCGTQETHKLTSPHTKCWNKLSHFLGNLRSRSSACPLLVALKLNDSENVFTGG